MLKRIGRRRGLARTALSGLATGFAVLAALAWIGTVTTERAVTDIRMAAQISITWDQVLTLVANEDETMNDYLRAPDELGTEPLTLAIGSAKPSLRWLAQHGNSGNSGEVRLVSATYDTFTSNLTAIVEAGRRNDQAELIAQADQASLSAASVRKQLTVGTEFEHLSFNETLRKVEQTDRRLRDATFIVLGVDMMLLLMCANTLLTYQRWIEHNAERSQHRSHHDSLTDLPNRVLFEERLNEIAAVADEIREPLAVLMLDLDGFKTINDTLGHHYGDLLLVAVARRLIDTVREGDMVARLGGDEFAIVVKLADVDQIGILAERVQAAIAVPIDLDGELVQVGVSIGVALCPEHTKDPHELVRFADAAMYVAKRGGFGIAVYGGDPQPSLASAPDSQENMRVDETR